MYRWGNRGTGRFSDWPASHSQREAEPRQKARQVSLHHLYRVCASARASKPRLALQTGCSNTQRVPLLFLSFLKPFFCFLKLPSVSIFLRLWDLTSFTE